MQYIFVRRYIRKYLHVSSFCWICFLPCSDDVVVDLNFLSSRSRNARESIRDGRMLTRATPPPFQDVVEVRERVS